jgi:hypothetical protein
MKKQQRAAVERKRLLEQAEGAARCAFCKHPLPQSLRGVERFCSSDCASDYVEFIGALVRRFPRS